VIPDLNLNKIEKFPKTLLDKDFLGSVQMLYLLGKFSRFLSLIIPVLRIRIRDQGWKKSRARIRDPGCTPPYLILRPCQFFGLKILSLFDADPDPGSRILSTLDPGWKISDPGSWINILDPQHWIILLFIL
jgi:hypothetical protein